MSPVAEKSVQNGTLLTLSEDEMDYGILADVQGEKAKDPRQLLEGSRSRTSAAQSCIVYTKSSVFLKIFFLVEHRNKIWNNIQLIMKNLTRAWYEFPSSVGGTLKY